MAETFEGSVSVTTVGVGNADGETTIFLNGENADAVLGGPGQNGNIVLQDAAGTTRIEIDAGTNNIVISDSSGNQIASLGFNGLLHLGGDSTDGDITLTDTNGQTRISMSASTHEMRMNTADGNRVVTLGTNGNLTLGGTGMDGDLIVRDSANVQRITLDGDNQRIRVYDADGNRVVVLGPNGNLTLGGAGGHDGDLALLDGDGQNRINFDAQNHRTRFRDADGNIVVDLGPNGNLTLGGAGGHDGDLALLDGNGQNRINFDAQNHRLRMRDSGGNQVVDLGPNGNMVLGGAGGHDGDLALMDGAGQNRINFDAQNHQITLRDSTGHEFGRLGEFGNLLLGSGGHDGDILLYPSSAANIGPVEDATIHLDANAGDITLRNADCAEEFNIATGVCAEPGTVMCLDSTGDLRPTQSACERTVVGVISGAGSYKPGIVLDKQPGQTGRKPIALMGKTFVKVSDEGGPIEPGDLLTSSSTEGVAMRAPDNHSAFGAIIGKAFAAHSDAGEGLIPMIIMLN